MKDRMENRYQLNLNCKLQATYSLNLLTPFVSHTVVPLAIMHMTKLNP